MKKFLNVVILAVALLPATVTAEIATTIVDTALTDKPVFNARAISTIPAKTSIEVIEKRKLWCKVKYGETVNWARCFNLKFARRNEDTGNNEEPDLSGGNVVGTIGIRGLNASDLQAAQPDPQQLKKLDGFQASEDMAASLANEKALQSRNITYLNEIKESQQQNGNGDDL